MEYVAQFLISALAFSPLAYAMFNFIEKQKEKQEKRTKQKQILTNHETNQTTANKAN